MTRGTSYMHKIGNVSPRDENTHRLFAVAIAPFATTAR